IGKTSALCSFLQHIPGKISPPEFVENPEKVYSVLSASTCYIPKWLHLDLPSDESNETIPADNVKIYDFVGYGRSVSGERYIDDVIAFIRELFVQTSVLFSDTATPDQIAEF